MPSGESLVSNGPTAMIVPGLSVSSELNVASRLALAVELVEAAAADGEHGAVVGLRRRGVGQAGRAVGGERAGLGAVGLGDPDVGVLDVDDRVGGGRSGEASSASRRERRAVRMVHRRVCARRRPGRIGGSPSQVGDDVHPHHEVVAERVDVGHAALGQHDAVRVADRLVHVHGDAAVAGLREAHRLDVRVDQRELPPPVRAHRVAAAHPAALHPVRPVDVVVHQRQRGLDVARVEGLVGALEQFHAADTTRGRGGMGPAVQCVRAPPADSFAAGHSNGGNG